MKAVFISLFYSALILTGCSPRKAASEFVAQVSQQQFAIGRSAVSVRKLSFGTETPFLLLQLHSDETTAAETAGEMAYRWGIDFIQVLNHQARLISFVQDGKTYQFDPNRIFSDAGIRKTLQLSNGSYTDAAFREVKQLSQSLLFLLPQQRPIVAVHNNTDGRFNILQYKESNSGQVHLNAAQDADDFFITNSEEIFSMLKAKNFNTVLEDPAQMEDDGSLSLYCTRKNIRYINVEAQHGHQQEQRAMLEVVRQIFK